MNSFTSFSAEFQKIAALGHVATDLAGLGMLAVPSIAGNRMSENQKRGTEVAGLGTLAAGVAHEHRGALAAAGREGAQAFKSGGFRAGLKSLATSAAKHASINVDALTDEILKISAVPQPFGKMMAQHALGDAFKAQAAQGAGAAKKVLRHTPQNFELQHAGGSGLELARPTARR